MATPGAMPRRAMFRRSGTTALRPPWSSEHRIRDGCSSCGDCLQACPEAILIPGPAATPVVDFTRGGCIFCGDCVMACPEAVAVFAPRSDPPWNEQGGRVAQISAGCMLGQGIACQLCTDSCEAEALRLDLSHRPVGRIALDLDHCTGCGACVESCPSDAISIIISQQIRPKDATHD